MSIYVQAECGCYDLDTGEVLNVCGSELCKHIQSHHINSNYIVLHYVEDDEETEE